MKRKILAMITCVLLLVSLIPLSAAAASEDIVILYENDVHCSIEGYSKLAAMKKELQQTHAYVGVVSGGDFIQGNSLGVISQGEYMVKLMNLIGYDAVTLGNHEFDFRIERLDELVGLMDTKPICCNFQKIGESESYFKPYSIVSYGDTEIAYIGITTPTTVTSSSPAQFKDDNGAFLYTFHSADLYEIVQANIDAAKAEGADYIIAVSHIGYAEDEIYGDIDDIETLIQNTDGFDVVLDAHSHSVIESMTVTDRGGNDVLLTSTGTKFEYVGKLTISDGQFETSLIKTAEYAAADADVDAYIAQVYTEYAEMAERKVAVSEVDLNTHDADGKRLVRNTETTLGDFCADAFRHALDADIGYINGGGMRAPIAKGDVTFNHLLNIQPFNNTLVLAEVSGQVIRDMMEMAMMVWPVENGAFPHVSGLTFSVNTAIPSSVVLNEFEEFDCVAGDYRVYDMQVYNRETEQYEPLVLDKTYTLAASNYYLLDLGSGMTMLGEAKILQNDGILDVEALERYVVEALDGVIGQEYADVTANILFTDGYIENDNADTPEESEVIETPEINDDPVIIETPETEEVPADEAPAVEESVDGTEDVPKTADTACLIWILMVGVCMVSLVSLKPKVRKQ